MGNIKWCAACGNPDLIIDTKKEGYSYAKGIIGTLVLGTGGAVAGVNGKETIYYHCPKCGQTLSYPMSDIEVQNILSLMDNPVGNKAALEKLRQKYPNMVWPKSLQDSPAIEVTKDEELENIIIHFNALETAEILSADSSLVPQLILKKLVPLSPIKGFIYEFVGPDNQSSDKLYDIYLDVIAGHLLEESGNMVFGDDKGPYYFRKLTYDWDNSWCYITDNPDQIRVNLQIKEAIEHPKVAKYKNEIFEMVSNNQPVGLSDIIFSFSNKHPDVNVMNPYRAQGTVMQTLNELIKSEKIVKSSDTGLYGLPDENSLVEEAIKNFTDNTYPELFNADNDSKMQAAKPYLPVIFNYFKNNSPSRFSKLRESISYTSYSAVQDAVHLLRSQGILKIYDNRMYEIADINISDNDIRRLMVYPHYREILGEYNEVFSYACTHSRTTPQDIVNAHLNVNDYLINTRSAINTIQEAVNALMSLVYIKSIEYHTENGKFIFTVPKEVLIKAKTEKEEKERKQKEKELALKNLTTELEDARNHLAKIQPEIERRLREIELKQPDTAEQQSAIGKLSSERSLKLARFNSLGLFKRKEKKQLESEIDSMDEQIENIKQDIEEKKQQFENQFGEEKRNLNKELKDAKEKVDLLNFQLSNLEN